MGSSCLRRWGPTSSESMNRGLRRPRAVRRKVFSDADEAATASSTSSADKSTTEEAENAVDRDLRTGSMADTDDGVTAAGDRSATGDHGGQGRRSSVRERRCQSEP
ncbi:hypothetical protein PIB30_060082 [Stylosanthes scabra]|uniref:Uncharacterized protein n=1 Tax=Stylosanthes scabra TaxID=79078 RepID=A0ABU6VKN8_9FABA|nr:hypothetical protein [Stylosanthes scabra]